MMIARYQTPVSAHSIQNLEQSTSPADPLSLINFNRYTTLTRIRKVESDINVPSPTQSSLRSPRPHPHRLKCRSGTELGRDFSMLLDMCQHAHTLQ